MMLMKQVPDQHCPETILKQGGAGSGATPPVRKMNPTGLIEIRMSTKPVFMRKSEGEGLDV